jgi:hypothetical protein
MSSTPQLQTAAQEADYPLATPFLDLLIEADTPTDWLVEGIIPEQNLVLVHGQSYSGKSYIVSDLAASLALGLDWHGHRIDRQRRVLFVLSEGRKGYSRRLASALRWKANHHPEVVGHLRDLPLFRHEAPLILDPRGKADRQESFRVLGKEIERLGIEVVVFDVFADFTPGLDENSREMGHAVKMLAPDVLPGKPVTILVHHEGHDNKGRPRGTSAFLAAPDVRIAVDITGQDNPDVPTRSVIRLRNKKQKDEDPFRPFALVLEKPDPSLNAPIITGWANADEVRVYEPSTKSLTDKQARILDSVRSLYELGSVSQADVVRDTGISPTTVSSGVKALRRKGFLVDGDGPLVLTALGQAEVSTNVYEVSTNPTSHAGACSTTEYDPLEGSTRSHSSYTESDAEEGMSDEALVGLRGVIAAVAP